MPATASDAQLQVADLELAAARHVRPSPRSDRAAAQRLVDSGEAKTLSDAYAILRGE